MSQDAIISAQSVCLYDMHCYTSYIKQLSKNRQPLMLPVAIPSIKYLWNTMNKTSKGTKETNDMAKSEPHALVPVGSTNIRSASATVKSSGL